MTTLYIANKNYSSWSLRAWLLMKELAIPFEERLLPFGDDSAWGPFRALGGGGKVPTLQQGDLLVWDSLAIVEHLAERHPQVWPSRTDNRAWARSACAEMHSGFTTMRDLCSMNIALRVELTERPADLVRDIERIHQLWLEGLERFGGPFLAGDRFSAVDAFYAPIVLRFETYGLCQDTQVQAYMDQIRALPALEDWCRQALAEPWVDPEHEADCVQCGRVLEDHRQGDPVTA
ncbi:glutathione S-transferase family protein [Marinobacter xestospongiae]|uniref:glutathione S-transferase family protein n=1 Tax=Marinobacter xestospongiae TaxID=994319 RepID=UPI0020032E52|nr:glutathione S-transferase family protein [Marinobacter xestospongiae]MCK7565035.1 glutathione S-transferase family protein [Marinobacter xestospongiae]